MLVKGIHTDRQPDGIFMLWHCSRPVSTQVMKGLRKKEKPLVIDADGLYIVTKNLDLVKGYPHAILTPNKNEYQRLADQLGIDVEQVTLCAH